MFEGPLFDYSVIYAHDYNLGIPHGSVPIYSLHNYNPTGLVITEITMACSSRCRVVLGTMEIGRRRLQQDQPVRLTALV